MLVLSVFFLDGQDEGPRVEDTRARELGRLARGSLLDELVDLIDLVDVVPHVHLLHLLRRDLALDAVDAIVEDQRALVRSHQRHPLAVLLASEVAVLSNRLEPAVAGAFTVLHVPADGRLALVLLPSIVLDV